MWRELVAGLFRDAELTSPATEADIRRVETTLGLTLPEDLKGFLVESNGAAGNHGTRLVWSTDQMIEQNRLLRTNTEFAELYMPFDSLFFFGDGGNGDRFGYRVLGGQIRDTSWIFRWDHESDNREWFARGLQDYLDRAAPEDE
jgi:hypothetical protein